MADYTRYEPRNEAQIRITTVRSLLYCPVIVVKAAPVGVLGYRVVLIHRSD